MDGTYRFTICGDPLYFAPEIVTQQGYDYSIDIWAYGILLYELYEGGSPFGTSDTEETTIFKAITAFRPSKLNFSRAPHPARKLIMSLLQFGPEERAGYKTSAEVTKAEYFAGKSMIQSFLPPLETRYIFISFKRKLTSTTAVMFKIYRGIPWINSEVIPLISSRPLTSSHC